MPASPFPVDFELLYLLRCEERFGVRRALVRAVRVRRLNAGGLDRPAPFYLDGDSRAPFVTREDRHILALLRRGQALYAREASLSEDSGAEALLAIALSGRGRWRDADGPRLHMAGPLAAGLVWRLADDGWPRVGVDGDRSGRLVLPVAPPWYLDPDSGACGPLEIPRGSGLDPWQALTLALVPGLCPDAAPPLRAEAERRLRELKLPLPIRTEPRTDPPQPPADRDECRPVPSLYLYSWDLGADPAFRGGPGDLRPGWIHGALLTFDYGGTRVAPQDPHPTVARLEHGLAVTRERDLEAERAAVVALEDLGLLCTPETLADLGDRTGLHFELLDADAWTAFMTEDLPGLMLAGFRVELGEDFRFRAPQAGAGN